ncbi:hypothetical protein [Halalkalicoccus ordinarius]|uniref:hypothetical protein n=1 Tax=Halalkalicoccus ordinarius TaxID=3116651 RepID=UPI00300EDBAB
MQIKIDSDTTQLLAGTPLPTDALCTECDQTVRAGERCIIYAIQPEDAATYTLERLYCADCAPNGIPSPTRETSEYLFQARLTRTLDDRTQTTYHTLHEPHLIATSLPSEGTVDTPDDNKNDALAALISDAYCPGQTIYHLDDGDGHPLCNCRGDAEYTAISLADAKAHTARRGRNCQIVRQGEQETRPCPHCTTEIKLSAWPQHIRAWTGTPTDATAETDPDGDPATTDTQPATRFITGTSAQAHTSPSQE